MPEEPDTPTAPVPVTSSVPPELPKQQKALFREVLTLLEEKRIPFVVSGAFALRQHTGIFRFTKDLDLFLTAQNAPCALAYLKEDGFLTEMCDPLWLMKVHRDEFFVDLITGMSNAAIVVEDCWIRHAQPALVYGVETRVLAPEELIASKLFVTRRERFDGADIAHVIFGTQGKLVWDRILKIAGEHWEMLLWALILFRYVYPAQTGYVPVELWRDLLGRFQEAIAEPDPTNFGQPDEMEPFINAIVRIRIPTIAVLGNHDYESGKEVELMRMLSTAGVKVLDGRLRA